MIDIDQNIKKLLVDARAKIKLSADYIAIILAVLYLIIVLILQKNIVWGWMPDGHSDRAVAFEVLNFKEAMDLTNLPFLYSLLTAILNVFIKNLFLSGKLINVFSLFIIFYIVYLLGKETFNEKTGLLSAILFALTPAFFDHSVDLFVDILFTLFFISSIYFVIRKQGAPTTNLTISGILGGLALLTKSSGILLIIPVIFYLLFCCSDKTLKWKKIFYFITAFFLISSPVWIYSILFLKKITLGEAPLLNILIGTFKISTAEARLLLPKYPTISSVILNHPSQFLENIIDQMQRFIDIRGQYLVRNIEFLYIFMIGMFFSFYQRNKKGIFLFIIFISYTMPILVGYVVSRYVMPIVPIMLLFISYAIIAIYESISCRVRSSNFIYKDYVNVFLTLLLLIGVFYTVSVYIKEYEQHYSNDVERQPVFNKDAYNYFKDNSNKNDPILIMNVQLGDLDRFFSDDPLYMRTKNFLNENIKTPEELYEYIKLKNIKYLEVDNYYGDNEFSYLMAENNPMIPENFERVFIKNYGRSNKIRMVIYKINKPENLKFQNLPLPKDYHVYISILGLPKLNGLYLYEDNFTTTKYSKDSHNRFITYSPEYNFLYPRYYDSDGILEYYFFTGRGIIREVSLNGRYYTEQENNFLKIYYNKDTDENYTIIKFLDRTNLNPNYTNPYINSSNISFLLSIHTNKSSSKTLFDSRLSGLRIAFKIED